MSIKKSIVFVMGLSILLGSVSMGMQYQPTQTDNARWDQLANAAAIGNAQQFDQILQQDQRFSPNYFDGNGNSVVHIAALNGHIDVINAIIKNNQTPGRTGISFNGKNKDGDTPMHLAIKLRRWDIASKIALDCPSVLYWSIKNKDGETPIGLAIETDGFGWLVPLALSKEDPTYWKYSGIFDKDKNGETIVHKALRRGRALSDTIFALGSKCPKQFYVEDNNGHTPLESLLGGFIGSSADLTLLMLDLVKNCPIHLLTKRLSDDSTYVVTLFDVLPYNNQKDSWKQCYEFLYSGIKDGALDACLTKIAVCVLCYKTRRIYNDNDKEYMQKLGKLTELVLTKYPNYVNETRFNETPFKRYCNQCDEPDFALILLKFGANLDDAEAAVRRYNREKTLALIAEWRSVLSRLNKTQNDLQTSPELREQAVAELTKLRQENDNNNDN